MANDQREFFNDLASTWQIPVQNIAIAQAMIERLGIKAGERVLDIGCGTGILYELLRQIEGIHYVGIDISDKMLSQFRERFCEVNLVQGDFENERLLFGETFDYCIIFNSIPHFDAMSSVMAQASRCLGQSGKLVIVHCRTREGLKGHHQTIGYQSPKAEPIPLDDELLEACHRAGFEEIIIEDKEYFYFEAVKSESLML